MKAEDSSECIKIDPEKSIIIVSDLHLGALEGETTSEDFLSFLGWLDDFCNGKISPVVETGQGTGNTKKNKTLKPPQLLILLGDILEFWVPRGPLRGALFRDSYPLFSKLHNLPIPIVYVIGNHDREVYEIKGIFPVEKDIDKKIIIEPDQFSNTKNTGDLINPLGLRLGNNEYVFLHGHQFDKKFQFTGSLSEFPGWVSNNSSVFEAHPWFRRISWFIFFFGIVYPVLSWVGLLSFLPSIVHSVFWASIFHSVFLVSFGISIPIFLISIPSDWLSSIDNAISKNSVGKSLQVFFQKISYTARGKRIDEFIARRKFEGRRDIPGPNVVVFGHTHSPDDYNDPTLNKRFINSGSWDSETPADVNREGGLRYQLVGIDKDTTRKFVWNSFIYIDNQGPCSFVWNVEGEQKPTVRFLKNNRRRASATF